MKIIAEFCIIPLGVGLSLSKYIAACEDILQKRGLTIQLHAEGTNIEGDYEAVMQAVKACIETVHQLGSPRIVTTLKISSRTDKTQHMDEKIKSVQEHLSSI